MSTLLRNAVLFLFTWEWTCWFNMWECSGSTSLNKLLFISLDGFRHDYLEIVKNKGINISGFEKIRRSGLFVSRVENEFVTRTAPNHFSMVTGLHEESHGIVDNTFYDPVLNDVFSLRNSTHPLWFDVGAEPIWITNQRNGHESGVTSWPGSTTRIKGMLPSIYYPKFNVSVSLRDSINNVIRWLERDNLTLALLYHHEPDAQGHKTGPYSFEVAKVIGEINQDIEYLLSKVNSISSLRDSLNIIVSSDHGMSETSADRVIVLNDYISNHMYFSPGDEVRVVWGLWPRSGFTSADLMSKLLHKHLNMSVFLKENLPKHFFYSQNIRIAPVIVYASPGWVIARSSDSKVGAGGDHGYDPTFHEMSPFFVAMGPGFKSNGNTIYPTIKMVDIYPMMCHLLGLKDIGPHNGSLNRVLHMLNSPARNSWFDTNLDIFCAFVVFSLAGGLSVAIVASVCCAYWRNRTSPMRSLRPRRKLLGVKLSVFSDTQHRSTDQTTPEHLQRLLQSLSDSDEVTEYEKPSRFHIDDNTLIGMLHEPHSRH